MRRYKVEELARTPPTKIQIRSSLEPRDERLHLPKSFQLQRSRPTAINISSGLTLDTVVPNQKDSLEDQDIPPLPEIVDSDIPRQWKRKGGRSPLHSAVSPSVYSQCSTRQSETSFGILDYYTGENVTPRHSEDVAIPLPPVDVAMKEFDFGIKVVPVVPSVVESDSPTLPINPVEEDVQAGAEDISPVIQKRMSLIERPPTPYKIRPKSLIMTPPSTQGPKIKYSLFPTIKSPTHQTSTSVPPSPAITNMLGGPQTPQNNLFPKPSINFTPEHRHPDTSYRPRRESISGGSMHSRKDSLTSIRSSRRIIPLRILSSSTISSSGGGKGSASKNRDSQKSSSSTASPPSVNGGLQQVRSRWSDETITLASPTAPLSGYNHARPSFGSLFGSTMDRDVESLGQTYPDCFFEDDDDEAVPLRRRLGSWTRRSQERKMRRGRFDERSSGMGRKIVRILLCGGCV